VSQYAGVAELAYAPDFKSGVLSRELWVRIPPLALYCTSALLHFFFAQRACTALRDASLRCSFVMLAARVRPPDAPPFLPILTKKSRISGGSFFAMPQVYVGPVRMASTFLLTYVGGVRIINYEVKSPDQC
jgi:hypothetical protein